MAHSAMHFGIGLTSGALAGIPLIYRALHRKLSSASAARQWLLISYAAGIAAVFPALLNRIGIPETITSSWPMNIFFLYPFINLRPGGALIGEMLIVTCFLFQYFMLMILLWHSRRMIQAAKNDK